LRCRICLSCVVGRLLTAVEHEAGEISSAFGSLQVSSESLRCLLAGRSAGEEDAASGFISVVI
jgi:hypothetical protein